MARVRRDALDGYDDERSRLAEAASAFVKRELGQYAMAHPDASVAELREAAKAAMEAALERYGGLSSGLAAALYDAIMEAEGLDVPAADATWEPDRDRIDRVARYQAGKVDGDSPDVDGLVAQCASFVRDATKRAADHTVMGNVERDRGRGVRYARVLHGERSCTFCVMLASRGCVYSSFSAAAAGNHRGCDCSVVPGRKGQTTVEGQDLEALKRRWVRLQAVDDDPSLPRAAKERLKDLVADEEVDAGAVVARARACMETVGTDDAAEVLEEIGRRNAGWILRGTEPPVDYSSSPRSSYGRMLVPGDYSPENIVDRGEEWRDIYAHDTLSRNGLEVSTRQTDAPKGYSNIDLLIDGELWEVKSPKEPDEPPKPGRELAYVESTLRSAKKQFQKQYDPETDSFADYKGPVRVVFNNYYRLANDDDVSEKLKYEMGRHCIDEILLVCKDGCLRRIKR